MYNTDPSSILTQVSSAVGVSAAVLKEAWPLHSFNGTILDPDVLDFLVTWSNETHGRHSQIEEMR
jgi:hypothetical protein